MEFRKNDLVTLEIEDCGIDGEGIGKADGFTVFVKDAVIGDTVTAKIIKAKKNYGYGRLMEVLKPSPYRVEPKCEFARQCTDIGHYAVCTSLHFMSQPDINTGNIFHPHDSAPIQDHLSCHSYSVSSLHTDIPLADFILISI